MRAILRGGIYALVATSTAASGFAQSKELQFDVSVIRPLGPRGGPAPIVGTPYLPGGWFRDPGTTLRVLIDMAYDVRDLGIKIIGLPEWAEAATYSIEAKAGPEYPAEISPNQNEANIKAMLRTLLADRFHLKIHQEARKTKAMTLETPKGGAKLRPVSAPVPPEKEGWLDMALGDRRGAFSGKKITIVQLAEHLSLVLKQPVVDKTGLMGFYDFNERWVAPQRARESAPANTLGPNGIAQLVSLLNQNLGLVLKSETVSAPFWVVDHVEMPEEN